MKTIRVTLKPFDVFFIKRAQMAEYKVNSAIFGEYVKESDKRVDSILSTLPIENPESAVWDNRR